MASLGSLTLRESTQRGHRLPQLGELLTHSHRSGATTSGTGRNGAVHREATPDELTGCFVGVQLGVLLYGVAPLLATMLQQLMGYPVSLAGLCMAPRGIGSIFLEHLAGAAAECGIDHFEAEVLSENRSMIQVFRRAGYEISRSFDGSTLHLEFAIDPTEALTNVRNSREAAAEARSLARVLNPGSVAVIGASDQVGKIGHTVMRNLIGNAVAYSDDGGSTWHYFYIAADGVLILTMVVLLVAATAAIALAPVRPAVLAACIAARTLPMAADRGHRPRSGPSSRPCPGTGSCRRRATRTPRTRRWMRRRGRLRAGRCRRRAAPPPRRSGCRGNPESGGRR